MDDVRATHQDIRPINVLILNLMPTKEATETQLLRLLANTPLQINVDFLYMASHKSKNTAAEHMESFYKTFEDIKDNYYDGLIVTGAPVEKMDFEEVDYWEELTQVFEWAKRHVFLPCTSVGEPRLVCTTVTGFKKLSSVTNYLASMTR